MGAMKSPGVYILEKNAFANSIVEVATAVPAFIGYTEKADNKGKPLKNKPWRITSMAEFISYFGGPPIPLFTIAEKQVATTPAAAPPAAPVTPAAGAAATTAVPTAAVAGAAAAKDDGKTPFCTLGGKGQVVSQTGGRYFLYYSMLLFYRNGGGPCYIVSVGTYADAIDGDVLSNGIEQLTREQEPTMVVAPDAMLLKPSACKNVQDAILQHCLKMRNRFAILDVPNGFKSRQDPSGDCIDAFRSQVGTTGLSYAAAYYPWIDATIVQEKDLQFDNIANRDRLCDCLKEELGLTGAAGKDEPTQRRQQREALDQVLGWDGKRSEEEKALLNKTLVAISPVYNTLLTDIKNGLNLLPPSGAIAGIYSLVDATRGVWKAPANVSLSSVVGPALQVTHDDQEDLNVTTQGKSINAIRAFIGEGTLVWGARTLDGNSLDWRYINVRRTMLMLEESVKLATKAYVFEPNTANTWITVKSMIRNFLTGIWKRGGLAGASPEEAFAVSVGLNETMTPQDILEGIMRVTVLVAISRPAEFIEITFQQQMQKS